jgi:hypothetical protein
MVNEDTLQNHRCENLKSDIWLMISRHYFTGTTNNYYCDWCTASSKRKSLLVAVMDVNSRLYVRELRSEILDQVSE